MKSLAGILGVLCVLVVSSCAGPAAAPHWLEGFRYRIPITITESGGYTLKDYQIKLEIQGFTPKEPNCVDFSRIKSAGEDVVFTNDQHEVINHWIQSWDNQNKTARLWIKVPEILPYQETIIYMYYGGELQVTDYKLRSSDFDRTMTKLEPDRETRGLWHLDGGGADASPNKNHAREVKATWFNKDAGPSLDDSFPPGRRRGEQPFNKGNAAIFDGKTQYVEIPYSETFDFAGLNKISVECWVFPLTNSDYAPIISRPGNLTLFMMSDGRLGCYIYGPKPQDYYFSKTKILLDGWTHVALVYDGGFIRFYINGKEDATHQAAGTIKPCPDRIHNVEYQKSSLYFAYDPIIQGPQYFCGMLDEVRILSRVLSEGEIRADRERRKYCPIEPEVNLGEESDRLKESFPDF